MPYCPACDRPLLRKPERLGARCPYCRAPLYERSGVPRPAGPDDNRCAAHESNAAVGTCQRCGNYLCPVCRTRWRGQAVCIAGVNRPLEGSEAPPEEARAHLRQAVLALIFGLAAWGVVVVGVVVVILGGALSVSDMAAGQLVMLLGALVIMSSPLLSVPGIGQGAAAIRTRGGHMILATAGLLLSALHVGLLIGMFCSNIWQM